MFWAPLLVLCLALPAVAQKSVDELFAEAQQLLGQRQQDRAIALLRKADKREDRFEVKMLLALTYNSLRSFKNGERYARSALEHARQDSERAMAENLIGVALFAGGAGESEAIEEALHCFSRAVQLSKGEFSTPLLSGAEALLQLGRDAEAIPLLERFLASSPTDPNAIGRARALLDNPVSARIPSLPSFAAETLEGASLTSDDLAGKVVLFDFWGTWCAPCRAAIPHLKTLAKRRGKMPFEVVSVSSDSSVDVVREFVEEHQMDWPQIWEEDQDLIRKLQIKSYPTYVLVDHEGKIVMRDSGWSPAIGIQVERELNRAVRVYKRDKKRQGKADAGEREG